MTPHNELRLLPWSGSDGRPCYLSTEDGGGGFLSRLADNTEELLLDIAAELGEHALEVLSDGEDWPNELRLLVMGPGWGFA